MAESERQRGQDYEETWSENYGGRRTEHTESPTHLSILQGSAPMPPIPLGSL